MKTKSSAPATTKALQAWQSELRRLEKRLVEWEQALGEREENLEKQEAAFEAAVDGANEETIKMYADKFKPDLPKSTTLPDDDECYCEEGTCNIHPNQDFVQHCIQKDQTQKQVAIGDEIKWLENLWRLEDKRKKKK
jgi:hypothetical protein